MQPGWPAAQRKFSKDAKGRPKCFCRPALVGSKTDSGNPPKVDLTSPTIFDLAPSRIGNPDFLQYAGWEPVGSRLQYILLYRAAWVGFPGSRFQNDSDFSRFHPRRRPEGRAAQHCKGGKGGPVPAVRSGRGQMTQKSVPDREKNVFLSDTILQKYCHAGVWTRSKRTRTVNSGAF